LKISNDSKEIIVKEFEKVLELMSNTKDHKEKLYYFSATYAMVSRVLNIEYDDMLIFIHSVLLNSYSNINSFFNNIISNKDTFYSIPKNYFDILENALRDLTRAIDQNDELVINNILKRFSLIGYITTGNGNYLYKKGMLRIE